MQRALLGTHTPDNREILSGTKLMDVKRKTCLNCLWGGVEKATCQGEDVRGGTSEKVVWTAAHSYLVPLRVFRMVAWRIRRSIRPTTTSPPKW
jgi:hypothetical protein